MLRNDSDATTPGCCHCVIGASGDAVHPTRGLPVDGGKLRTARSILSIFTPGKGPSTLPFLGIAIAHSKLPNERGGAE